jgi:hypothetical protein
MEEASDGSFPRKQLALKGAPGDKGSRLPQLTHMHASMSSSLCPGARNLRNFQ